MDPVTSYYIARLGLNMSSPFCAEMAVFLRKANNLLPWLGFAPASGHGTL